MADRTRNELLEEILAAIGGAPVTTDVSNVTGAVSQGAYEYGHAGAADTVNDANGFVHLTNDAADPTTITTYGLAGLPDIYDSVTNRFTFDNSGVLALGDTVQILTEVSITTPGVNTEVEIVIELGAAGSGDYLTVLEPTNFKSAGTYLISRSIMFFMRTSGILTGGARILAQTDSDGTEFLVDDYIIHAYHTN
jgi:hypothetical protein